MKRLITSLAVMVIILVVAVLLVFQKHKVAHSSAKMDAQTAAMPKSSPSEGLLAGKVKETMDSGGYTYVLLETKDGEKWVAAPKTVVKVGQEITFAPGMVMKNFKSETLNRTFPEVVFSPGVAGSGAAGGMAAAMGGSCPSQKGDSGMAPHGGGMGSGMGAMSSSGRVVVPPLDLKIEKAKGDNAYTVAELYAQGKELDKKKVKVRGKVVKVSPNIMGKNWIHLQDGSGEPAKGTHDLVVTSQEKPEVGAIVVAEGVLEADKDFGAGYRYDVIVEEGVFEK
ncbi:MAG: DNA-binding protein [Deltaproteobacteria bacterium]|nr:DNA-binding protein [Deltaproteobacteria bacterium]